MPTKELHPIHTSRRQVNLVKNINLLFLTEPIWVGAAVSFVYISIISNWPSFIPWLCIAFAFAPFPLKLINYGYLIRRTPFDIPIAVLLVGIIVGMAVSKHFDVSLGAFQTFLASTAFYYSLINYSKPSWLITMGLPITAVVVFIVLAIAIKWEITNGYIPHGLDIFLVIMGAIALGIAIFAKRIVHRIGSALFVLLFLGAPVLLSDQSIERFLTLESFVGRMNLWLEVITPIEGSSLWTGLGLGCWPLTVITRFGHVHNAYLELYINTGVIGLLALICFLAIGAKVAADILYSPRNNLYYGFGAGVILASLAVLAVSFVESAAFGFGFMDGKSYHYILTPTPLILAGALVISRQLLWDFSTAKN